ncbi:MAG: glycosyltransferase family 4 protein [Proteobacteria bacterium]|nr:glycosyltransferase family 4 protein [Pseudomonadota bacterium]
MKILIVCTSVSWGGLEQIALRDAVELKKRGQDVHVLGMDRGVLCEKIKETDLIYHSARNQNKYFNFELISKLRKIISAFGIEVIHLHTFNTIFPVLFAVRHIKVKVFATRHIHVEHVKKDIFHRWYLGRLDKLFAISEFARNNLIQTYPLPPEKIQTLYVGINVEHFKRTEQKREQFKKDFPHISQNDKIIGVIGRIDPMKGQLEFVESIPHILAQYPKTHFLIVGRPTAEKENIYMEFVKNRTREMGIDNFITFTGFYEDVSIPLSAMDIFIMPSYFEAFGLIALQAMACEVPVIATEKGSIDEVIPYEDYGIKILPQSNTAIATAVIKLLGNKDLTDHIKQKAYQRVKEIFDEKRYFDNLIRIYKQTLNC